MPGAYLHRTEFASGRKNSEDRARVFEWAEGLVVVVADGAGGIRGGALASHVVVETVRAVVENPGLDVTDVGLWTALLRQADEELTVRRAGETTAVVVVVGPRGITGVSVGDSEAWTFGARGADDLTQHQERHRLGSGRARPVAFERPCLDGVLTVASDGLFRYAPPERIASTVRAGEVVRATERLIELVRLPSGSFQDDVGVVIVAPR